jgi:hypothetical protein
MSAELGNIDMTQSSMVDCFMFPCCDTFYAPTAHVLVEQRKQSRHLQPSRFEKQQQNLLSQRDDVHHHSRHRIG